MCDCNTEMRLYTFTWTMKPRHHKRVVAVWIARIFNLAVIPATQAANTCELLLHCNAPDCYADTIAFQLDVADVRWRAL